MPFSRQSIKLRALNAKNVLTCSHANVPCMLTCSGALCAYVPTRVVCSGANVPCVLTYLHVNVLLCLHSYIPLCLACLYAHVPTCFVCSRTQVPVCLECLRVSHINIFCVLMYSCLSTCLANSHPHLPI